MTKSAVGNTHSVSSTFIPRGLFVFCIIVWGVPAAEIIIP
jgi:hypothetical protein